MQLRPTPSPARSGALWAAGFAVATSVGLTLVIATVHADAEGSTPAPPTTVAACTSIGAAPDGTAGHQTISVTLPATTFLRLDAHGAVQAARTNTGCAPRPTDDVWVLGPADGEVRPATRAEVDLLVSASWAPAPWSPDEWRTPLEATA